MTPRTPLGLALGTALALAAAFGGDAGAQAPAADPCPHPFLELRMTEVGCNLTAAEDRKAKRVFRREVRRALRVPGVRTLSCSPTSGEDPDYIICNAYYRSDGYKRWASGEIRGRGWRARITGLEIVPSSG